MLTYINRGLTTYITYMVCLVFSRVLEKIHLKITKEVSLRYAYHNPYSRVKGTEYHPAYMVQVNYPSSSIKKPHKSVLQQSRGLTLVRDSISYEQDSRTKAIR